MRKADVGVLLNVNEEIKEVSVRHAETLLETLRMKLGLTGAKPGCENGDCGSCTILIDDIPYKSCLMLTMELAGTQHTITTIEGLHNAPIQEAFSKYYAFQCGYCTPGFIMNAHALLGQIPHPDNRDIQEWLESNICRCTSYEEIEKAVKSAAMSVHPPPLG